jgi:hypothetical protein
MTKKITVGTGVRMLTMARTDAIGNVLRETSVGYEVRLPNWQADGVHKDIYVRYEDVARARKRAERRRCVYCR